MTQISAESALIYLYFPRDVETFTQKDNSRNASHIRTISTNDKICR